MSTERIVVPTFLSVLLLAVSGVPAIAGGEIGGDRSAVAPDQTGLIEGTVFYRNDRKHAWRLARYYVKSAKSGELAEAVIALSGPSLPRSKSNHEPRIVAVDQKEMRFVPETVVLRAGDRVRFTNTDSQTHNISLNDPRLQFSDTIANGQQAVETFSHASGIRSPFALGCKFHSQMQGWIYVFDHPLFQTTGVDGRFRLKNVPRGEYRLDIAHSAGDLHASRLIQVDPNKTVKLDLILTPADRSAAE